MMMTGCQTTSTNSRRAHHRINDSMEALWIQNGEPIEFEDELWYPADDVESFIDSEMRLAGEYLDMQFFIDKVDVRPYNRLYTKFGKNKFRFFEKRISK